MQTVEERIKQKMGSALIELRRQKHKDGFPFMITDSAVLPDRQAFMEYASGKIEVVEFGKDFKDYHVLRELSSQEVIDFKAKYQLY